MSLIWYHEILTALSMKICILLWDVGLGNWKYAKHGTKSVELPSHGSRTPSRNYSDLQTLWFL